MFMARTPYRCTLDLFVILYTLIKNIILSEDGSEASLHSTMLFYNYQRTFHSHQNWILFLKSLNLSERLGQSQRR